MEVLETLTALEPLVAATMELVASVKFVASVKPAVKSVSTIPASAARISFRTIGHLAPSKLPPLL